MHEYTCDLSRQPCKQDYHFFFFQKKRMLYLTLVYHNQQVSTLNGETFNPYFSFWGLTDIYVNGPHCPCMQSVVARSRDSDSYREHQGFSPAQPHCGSWPKLKNKKQMIGTKKSAPIEWMATLVYYFIKSIGKLPRTHCPATISWPFNLILF